MEDKDICVKYVLTDGVARVTLNRPDKHNGLDMAMYHSIDKVIRQIRRDRSVRVVIVSGEGPSFCSGLDFKSVLKKPMNLLRLTWKLNPFSANLVQRVTVGWRRLKVPVIMVLHGHCWGGGLQIALGGDFRIAHPETSLAIMEAKHGIIPDMGGTLALRDNVSVDQMMRLAMTADPILAKEALYVQLITEIADDPMAAAEGLAKTLLARSPATNTTIKRMYQKAPRMSDGRLLWSETWRGLKIILGQGLSFLKKKR